MNGKVSWLYVAGSYQLRTTGYAEVPCLELAGDATLEALLHDVGCLLRHY